MSASSTDSCDEMVLTNRLHIGILEAESTRGFLAECVPRNYTTRMIVPLVKPVPSLTQTKLLTVS
jgi:hypothetical protein